MEIQDRNSLLQQLLGIRGNNMPSTPLSDNGFADILKTHKSENKDVAAADDFGADKAAKTTAPVKEKQDLPIKDNKKEAVEDKQPAKTENKKDKENKNENKVKEEAGAAAVSNNDAVQQPEKTATASGSDNSTVVPAEGETSASAPAEVLPAASAETIVLNPLNLVPVDGEIDVPEIVVLPESVAAVVDEVAVVSKVASSDGQPAAQPLTEEDALLLEQAKYLDEKIAAPEKLKIDVSVKEAKIAEPVAKDVLQNRFEIDSLFQEVDAGIAGLEADAAAPAADNNVVVINKPAAMETAFNPSNVKAFAFNEAQVTKDMASQPATDAANLVISGKEAVFETANSARAEAFAKLNETSSRDAFKGMGKEVVEQIKVNITKSAVKGVDTIDIQLKPEDLGKIQIKMHIAKDGKLHAEIIASRPETMDMLQKDVSGLSKAFNDAGYDTDSRSFNFSFQEENQAREQQKDDSGLLQFIGDTLEQEAESAAGNDNLGYNPLLGLNIKV